MAAKGTESKSKIFNKLMEVFPGSFWEDENKILRVPMDENGARVEIKVTLTAAKANLGGDDAASAFPAESPVQPTVVSTAATEITQEEKENVSKMLAALNL